VTTLVTGGCGFVGSFVVRALAAQGEDVVAYDINPDSRHLFSVLESDQRDLVRVHRGDLVDLANVIHVATSEKVDRIAHIAYLGRKATLANAAWSQYANIVGTNNVFEVALMLDTPVVWTSTIDVFGPKSVGADGIVRVDAPYDPNNIYGSCKAHNEVTAREYAELRGLRSIAVRLPPVFGPSFFPINSWVYFLPKLIESIIRTGAGDCPSTDEEFPFGYVDDIAAAIVAGFDVKSPAHRAVTLGGPHVSMFELLNVVRSRFPGATLSPVDYPLLGVVDQYDVAPAEQQLGWTATISPADGVERIASYYERTATA